MEFDIRKNVAKDAVQKTAVLNFTKEKNERAVLASVTENIGGGDEDSTYKKMPTKVLFE